MGAEKLSEKFPALVLAVQNTTHIVTSFSDPMHGSTIKAASGLKTRRFDAILEPSLTAVYSYLKLTDFEMGQIISLVSTLRPENKSGVELALAATRDLG
ncbi:unnamed protein product [Sphagnum jensenii]|uniref:Phospho-2-dehydro-3-deoxyheptonate aldolase n=1 Tax=Sphagnum jensenii TaxID=128206 RepID=A0ABP1AG46_9BRYO